MANITTILTTDVIEEGRQKANDNFNALNSELSQLKNQFDTHNHNSLYYTKDEVDAKIANALTPLKSEIIQLGIPSGNVAWGKIGNISMSASLGLVAPYNAKIVSVTLTTETGMFMVWTNLAIYWDAGSRLAVQFVDSIPGDESAPYHYGLVFKVTGRSDVALSLGSLNSVWAENKIVLLEINWI